MVKKCAIVSTVLLLLVVATTSLAQSTEKYQWKLVDTDEGCQIYTSPVAGKEYIAAKATCVIPVRIEVIGVILRDIPNGKDWLFDIKESKILKTVDDEKDVFIFWMHQHVPLLTDRDVVLKSEPPILRPGYANIKFGATNEMPYDSGEGYVRMPSLTSEFILEWIDGTHTRVTYITDPDLGKGLPKGISNSTIKKSTYKSLQGLMKMAKLQKYIDAAKTSKYVKVQEEGLKDGTLKL